MTAVTSAETETAPRPTAAGGALAGTAALVRFILRRDRLRLPLWLVGLTGLTVATAVSFADLYPTVEQRQATAETMNTPAGLAMSGPAEYLADYHVGAMMSHQMIGFMAVVVAVMSVLLVVRHTRAEEESGRAELVRASVVGRHAHLAAALIVVGAVNLVVAVLFAVGLTSLGIDSVTWSGSLLYGLAHAAVGIVFAGVAAVTVQISEHTRGASGLAFAVIALAYVLRAAGDAGTEALAWLSPIGWAQATYAYADDRWWPLILPLALTVALVAGATVLSTRRDLGAGLRQTRPGPRSAAPFLAHPAGLALRLQRGLLIGFAVGLALLGVTYGSILAEVDEMLAAVEGLEEVIAELGGATLVESFVSMIMVIMAIFASLYGVVAALRPRAEESGGRAEPLLATPLSRTRWVGGHVAVAMAGSAAVLVVGAASLGATGAVVLDDGGFLGDVVVAGLAYVPALWATLAVAVALYGLRARLAPLAWAVPAYAFAVGYLGQILQFPEWMANLSPFGNVPQAPAEDLAAGPLVVLILVAAALVALGLWLLRRRDLSLT